MKSYSLQELNEYIRRVLALNLSEPVWVSCELAQAQRSRGHFYFSLVQKDEEAEEEGILAQAEAVLWSRSYKRIRRRIGRQLDDILQEGMQVLLQIKVDYHERYGLKFQIEDIDPAYTLGRLALQKRQAIMQLQQRGLLDKNGELALPTVLQDIAIVSSKQAAGYHDFIRQLEGNPYGYQYRCRLFAAAVQGVNAEQELLRSLAAIEELHDHFDCVVIIRGGGARLDLMAFDGLAFNEAVAQLSLPVLSGIGHEIDQSLLDLTAHTALKTPTAVADFIIHHNSLFEQQIMEAALRLRNLASQQINEQAVALAGLRQQWQSLANSQLQASERMLDFIEERLPRQLRQHLQQQSRELEHLSDRHQLLSIESTLRRGYSITRRNGEAIGGTEEVKKGDLLQTQLRNGTLESQVINPSSDERDSTDHLNLSVNN
ncbi:MAG: exodeoxyribonuclease VII large subunit [Bacteroidota bacterium]